MSCANRLKLREELENCVGCGIQAIPMVPALFIMTPLPSAYPLLTIFLLVHRYLIASLLMKQGLLLANFPINLRFRRFATRMTESEGPKRLLFFSVVCWDLYTLGTKKRAASWVALRFCIVFYSGSFGNAGIGSRLCFDSKFV